jgi:hypothetical protein
MAQEIALFGLQLGGSQQGGLAGRAEKSIKGG